MTRNIYEHAVPLDEDGSLTLIVEMEYERVDDYRAVWLPQQSWLSVDGRRQDPSAELEGFVEREWRTLPGMPEALSRWEENHGN